MYYVYGKEPKEIIEASDIEFAVRKIKMAELYPEIQALPCPFREDEEGNYIRHKV